MKLQPNPEYVRRHLFVVLLMTALGGWFAYDGLVRYPKTPAAELYKLIEGNEAAPGVDLDGFKRQKTQAQYGFAFLAFLLAGIVGVRLYRSWTLQVDFDETGYTWRGKRTSYGNVCTIDRSQWEKKGILRVDGLTLDAWHHLGVRDLASHLLDNERDLAK